MNADKENCRENKKEAGTSAEEKRDKESYQEERIEKTGQITLDENGENQAVGNRVDP